MFTSTGLLQFYDWAQFSYDRLFDHAATLPEELLHQPLDGFGFPTICRQLVHIASCEDFWFTKLRGGEWRSWDVDSIRTVAAVRTAYSPVARRTWEFIAALRPEELMEPRRIDFGEGSGMFPPAGVLHHVLTHGFHHKGQVVAMCRLLGHPAPETDLDNAL